LERKRIFTGAAEGADPVGGQLLKGGSRTNPRGAVALGRIVDIPAKIAYIFLHKYSPVYILSYFPVFFKTPREKIRNSKLTTDLTDNTDENEPKVQCG
jgi:hypothetical protein